MFLNPQNQNVKLVDYKEDIQCMAHMRMKINCACFVLIKHKIVTHPASLNNSCVYDASIVKLIVSNGLRTQALFSGCEVCTVFHRTKVV
jgi:hypothetical protein